MEARQILAGVTATTVQATGTPLVSNSRNCAGLNLPIGGVLSMPNGDIVTLTAAAAFKPVCTPVTPPAIIANGGGGSVTIDDSVEGSMPSDDGGWTFSDFRDPFYASTFPQCYALAATTVVAYTLVIMLLITPRSFLDGGVVVLGRKGFTNGGTGPSIGGRPWLQKVAALSVAVSLTIASAATFSAAEEQYSFGIQNAKKMQAEVLGGNELKIIRIISNTFLWLAQAQTLIRLFPRQREKVIIKWTAFALITLDVIFQSLNSFQYTESGGRPGSFQDAVPALSYLFALSLGVLYAAWVIYYSLMKKRYAFWHPQMKNMCFVAALSLLAILIPIVFYILDISKPDFTGWGEYVRWVGAAAASVIVWEWVERIEALEREEKKDGILGREVFDGDEMLDMTSDPGLRRRRKGGGDGDKESSFESGRDVSPTPERGNKWPTVTSITAKYRSQSRPTGAAKPSDPSNTHSTNHDRIRFLQPPLWPARPAPAVTPISRTDTASAASTVYAIRYHPLTETTSRTTPPPPQTNAALSRSNSTASSPASEDGASRNENGDAAPPTSQAAPARPQNLPAPPPNRLRTLAQRIPFNRARRADEEERAVPTESTVSREEGITANPSSSSSIGNMGGGGGGGGDNNKWDLRGRFEEFAVTQAERLREKFRPDPDTDSLPVTVIPAPPRRGAALALALGEGEQHPAGPAMSSGVSRTLLPPPPPGDGHSSSPSIAQAGSAHHLRPIITQSSSSFSRTGRRLSAGVASPTMAPGATPGMGPGGAPL
jgi:hypothetical protein